MKAFRYFLLAAVLAAPTLVLTFVHATKGEGQPSPVTWNAAADFSATANPNAAWSYGFIPAGGSFTDFVLYDQPGYVVAGLDMWTHSVVQASYSPNVAHNGTADPITIPPWWGDITFPPGQLSFHPGPQWQKSVVRFTAPSDGDYQIDVTFSVGDPPPDSTTTDVHVLRNGTSLFDGDIDGNTNPNDSEHFSATQTLIAGDIIDFTVGFGNNGFAYDNTFLDATISAAEGPTPTPTPTPGPPVWHLPWEYGTSWYFNGGPHDWSAALPGACVDPPDNCSGTASGIDFGPKADGNVYAMADGVVYFAGQQTYVTCGGSPAPAKVVKIRHSGGWETWYLHLATFAPGIEGATNVYVQQGRFLGRAGATGVCDGGVHLHVELNAQGDHHSWDGQVVDGWTIHSGTNYNGYMSKDSTQVLPCVPHQIPPECTREPVGESHNPTYIPLLWMPFSLEQGGASAFVISLATGQQRMHVSWQWGGSTVVGWLTAPDGTVIDSSTIHPDVAYGSDATSAYYDITNPQAGEWTVHSFGAEVPDGPEPVLVAAGSVSAPVGGIAELPDAAPAGALQSASSKPPYAALAAGFTAALAALTAGAWYARRRRHKL